MYTMNSASEEEISPSPQNPLFLFNIHQLESHDFTIN